MFLDLDKQDRGRMAIRDDSGYTLSFGQVCDAINDFAALSLPRCVVFCLCENCAAALVGYLALYNNGQVPLLLSAGLDAGLREGLDAVYTPAYYWAPEQTAPELGGEKLCSLCGYCLLKTGHEPYPLHEDLSLLLTTSGSTGSPKLVRHKYGNLEANARNVAGVFGWTKDDRGICDLPMHYTMGLNVINTHLYAGAAVLMAKANLMDPDFWEFIKVNGGTSFCGVPFSYEIMRRIGFDKMELPGLRTLAEGGGKLTDRMFKWLTAYCQNSGRRFFATFGTSETSARIAYLPPELAGEKIASIGRAIPEGELFLLDETENEDGSVSGELAYRGPNVTMGYAQCREDLLKGDEFCGEYHTGDIARRDEDGCYYIIGRKKRFLKLFSLRVGLDDTERLLKAHFGSEFVCTGTDKQMRIFTTDPAIRDDVCRFISEKTKIHISAFKVVVLDEIPRNEYGKVFYAKLESCLN